MNKRSGSRWRLYVMTQDKEGQIKGDGQNKIKDVDEPYEVNQTGISKQESLTETLNNKCVCQLRSTNKIDNAADNGQYDVVHAGGN